MPTYTRHCNECDNIFDKICKISEKSSITVECPYCGATDGNWMISAPLVSMESSRFMTNRGDSGFKEVISKIQERNPRTSICER